MKISSENDKAYVKSLLTPYCFDLILVKQSKDIQEIGSNFLRSFVDLKYHSFVIKNDGFWCIFISDQTIPKEIACGGNKLENIYEVTYLNVLQRIKFIQRLNDEHLIYSTSDIKQIPDVDKGKLFQNGRKIEDKEVCAFLDEYQSRKIYPTDELMDLFVHKFKTADEIRYKWQQIVSWTAIAIAILLPIILNNCTSTKIDKTQISNIITTIKQHEKVNRFQDNYIVKMNKIQHKNRIKIIHKNK